ncbi:MAG: B12-binding domain-containing radical SAM protein [Spirochaetota bacterium]|nr:B12-binding domain-containing radical SAM protein [Spirochaetota bacterium]
MKKKILLVTPTVTVSSKERIKIPPIVWIPSLAPLMLAALTPDEFDVETIEEEIEDLDFDRECDLVGISCMTPTISRGYDIAKEFKKRGKTVVFGGVHPTILPDEALKHGDSVVVGEAEGVWGTLLKDYLKGELKPIYKNFQPDVDKYPNPRRDLVKRKGIIKMQPVMTTRGCPYTCDFCYVPTLYGRKIRHIPVHKVIEDIKSCDEKVFFFVDDNIIGYPKYAKELFKELIPLKIKWAGQASISFVKDEELMNLAKESGCVLLYFGLESVSKTQMKALRKSVNDLEKLEESIKKVNDLGIHFHASMIFGFEDDTEAVFDETLEFLMRNKVGSANTYVLTPFPGTPLYTNYKNEGKLITENWRYYDARTAVFKHKNLSPLKLTEESVKVRQKLYNWCSIGKRLSSNWKKPFLYGAINLAAKLTLKKQIKNVPIKIANVFNKSKL